MTEPAAPTTYQPSQTAHEALHQEILLPCVRVRTDKVGGSGTVLYSAPATDPSSQGEYSTYVLTNHHVIENLIEIKTEWDPVLGRDVKRDVRGIPEVHFFSYRWKSRAVGVTVIEADIAAYDADEDLALLRLRSGDPAPAVAALHPKGHETWLRIGMETYTIGAGLGEPPVLTDGFLAQFGKEIDNREFWINTAPSIFGNSGGATFLKQTHQFVGVPARIAVSGGFLGMGSAITHMGYIIPITRVYEFLDAQYARFIYDPAHTEASEELAREEARAQDKVAQALHASTEPQQQAATAVPFTPKPPGSDDSDLESSDSLEAY